MRTARPALLSAVSRIRDVPAETPCAGFHKPLPRRRTRSGEARARPFDSQREARQLGGAGQFAPGGLLQQSGSAVICCQTTGGLLEFAVRRPDVDLVLHFFERMADQARRAVSPEDA